MPCGVDDPTLPEGKVNRSDASANLGSLSNLETFSQELIAVARDCVPYGNSPISYDIKLLFDKVPHYIELFRVEHVNTDNITPRTDRLYMLITRARSNHFFGSGSADLTDTNALHEYAYSIVVISEYVIRHRYGKIGIYIHDLIQIASHHLRKMQDPTSMEWNTRLTRLGEKMFSITAHSV